MAPDSEDENENAAERECTVPSGPPDSSVSGFAKIETVSVVVACRPDWSIARASICVLPTTETENVPPAECGFQLDHVPPFSLERYSVAASPEAPAPGSEAETVQVTLSLGSAPAGQLSPTAGLVLSTLTVALEVAETLPDASVARASSSFVPSVAAEITAFSPTCVHPLHAPPLARLRTSRVLTPDAFAPMSSDVTTKRPFCVCQGAVLGIRDAESLASPTQEAPALVPSK